MANQWTKRIIRLLKAVLIGLTMGKYEVCTRLFCSNTVGCVLVWNGAHGIGKGGLE